MPQVRLGESRKGEMVKPLLISFSGGRTSAFMTKFLKERYPDRNIHIVFANTGKEREETLEFVDECDRRWNLGIVWIESVIHPEKGIGVSFKVVNFETAARNGEPFESMLSKHGIPNQAFPFCSRELKQYPINKYIRSLGYKDWDIAIGIRADEEHRVNRKTAKAERKIFPLVDDIRVDAEFIRNFWDKQCFDLKLKDYQGNCDLCWKKSDRKLMTMVVEEPKRLDWWRQMEKKYGKGEFVFFREKKSADALMEKSKQPFEPAIDQHELNKKQPQFDFMMDKEEACVCKST